MFIKTRRFGELEIKEDSLISFPKGLIGFPQARTFVLIRKGNSDMVGWLQAVDEPDLALPVISAHAIVADYPDVPIADAAAAAGLGSTQEAMAILAVLTALPHQPPTLNLLAPIVINANTRRGAQILLEGSRFSTRERFDPPAPASKVSAEEHATVAVSTAP